jgi:hypothetical protein
VADTAVSQFTIKVLSTTRKSWHWVLWWPVIWPQARKQPALLVNMNPSSSSSRRLESTLFISEAGNQLILLCVVPAKIPLGWSRLLVKETSKQIAAIVSTPDDQIDLLDLGLNDELLADKYGDSLSGIWNG